MVERIPVKALVVVADGGKAVLFRNTGKPGALKLQEERRILPDTAVEQGPSGSRPPDQTVKQTAEASFVNTLAHVLREMHGQNAFSEMVLVAAPATLGELREALHGPLESTVLFSLSKDLTNHPTPDIEKALSA